MAIHPSAIHLLFLLRCTGLWWEERLSLNATFRRLYRDIMRTGCCCSGAVGATLLHHRNGKSLFFRCDDDDFLFYVGLLRVDGYKPHGMLLPFCVCCRVSLSFRQRELRKLVKLWIDTQERERERPGALNAFTSSLYTRATKAIHPISEVLFTGIGTVNGR